MLADARVADRLRNDIYHVLVDEYQDTNFAQQQLLFRLADAHRTICVVGDEDQMLYRFRGANPDGFNAFERRFSRRRNLLPEFQLPQPPPHRRSLQPVDQMIRPER